MNMSSSEDSKRFSVVEIIESFITKINRIQKTLVGISISSLILAPMAIGLSIYLILHPHFFFILDEYDEFGLFLGISLSVIIGVSITWFALGIRQYSMLKSWNAKYSNYIQKKERVDKTISSEFSLDEDQEP